MSLRNINFAKIRTSKEWQTSLKEYADRRGPMKYEKKTEEKVYSQFKDFRRDQKGDKKNKQKKRGPGQRILT